MNHKVESVQGLHDDAFALLQLEEQQIIVQTH